MKKSIKTKTAIFPMPVLMVGTYNEDGSIDLMTAAWGMMLDMDKIVLNLTETHKTVQNIKREGYFTVALADQAHMKEADYVGIVSANNTPDKFAKSGLHAIKSENINAPIIDDFPLCMECELIEFQDDENGCGVVAKVLNVSVDEDILDENENVDPSRLRALVYDPFNHGYYVVGEKVGNAFKEGNSLK